MKPLQIKDVFLDDHSFNVALTLTSINFMNLSQDLKTIKALSFDVLEWRADYIQEDLQDMDCLEKGLKMIREAFPKKPLLFTFRCFEEGGQTKVSGEDLMDLRKTAIQSGCIDAIDLELFWFLNTTSGKLRIAYEDLRQKAKTSEIKIVLSYHDFKEGLTLPPIDFIFHTMMIKGADVAKVAVMMRNENQMRELEVASKEASMSIQIPHVLIGMGEMGKPSRYDEEKFASCLTYINFGKVIAPGQLNMEELNHLKSLRKNH